MGLIELRKTLQLREVRKEWCTHGSGRGYLWWAWTGASTECMGMASGWIMGVLCTRTDDLGLPMKGGKVVLLMIGRDYM